MPPIHGPRDGYRITQAARTQGEGMSNEEVHASSTRAGNANPPKVAQAIEGALADHRLTLKELEGGATARLLRVIGVETGASILSAMHADGLLRHHQVDPVDYRACLDLQRRARLPDGHADKLVLDAGVGERLAAIIDAIEQKLVAGPVAGAFVEQIHDEHLGDQRVVNQTALTWAPVDTATFMEHLPPERWAEECFDLRSLHNQVLERHDRPDGGYQITMLQRMEFGEGGTATDMTKRTVVTKWKDEETGQWRATAEWKVYASDPTAQIPHAGSMRIDTGRMEFRPVQRDGRWYTEVLFNNATQTDTATERKLLGLLGKNTPLRQTISAKLGASPLGILPFAANVVSRYREVGTGAITPRWQELKVND